MNIKLEDRGAVTAALKAMADVQVLRMFGSRYVVTAVEYDMETGKGGFARLTIWPAKKAEGETPC